MGTQVPESKNYFTQLEGPPESGLRVRDQALKQALLEAGQVFDALPLACCTVDTAGTILEENSALARLLGTSREGCRGRSLSRFFAAYQRDTIERQLRSVSGGALPRRVQLEGLELSERSGALCLTAVALPAGPGPRRCLVSLLEPRAQEHVVGVRPAYEREPMGTPGNSVSHDFGNLMQGVIGCLTLALSSSIPPSRARSYTEQALNAVRRSAALLAGWKQLEPKKEISSVAAQEASQAHTQGQAPFAGRALLVEDDWRVRLGIRHYLQQLGFEVIEAADAVEALSRASGALVLLVTDVVLPEVTGPKIQERLRQAYPDLKALYMSAHPPRYLIDQGLLQANDIILQKPFELKEFAFRLAELCPAQALAASPRN